MSIRMLEDRTRLGGSRAREIRSERWWHVAVDGRVHPWFQPALSYGRLERIEGAPYVWIQRAADLSLLAAVASAAFADTFGSRFCLAADAKDWAFYLGSGETAVEISMRDLLKNGHMRARSHSGRTARLTITPSGIDVLRQASAHAQGAAQVLMQIGVRALDAADGKAAAAVPKTEDL